MKAIERKVSLSVLFFVYFATPGLAIDIPPGSSLLPPAQWTRRPSDGEITKERFGQVQGIWGCVSFKELPAGKNIICGYLSIFPTPAPRLEKGKIWICTPYSSSNITKYTLPFNKGVCQPISASTKPPKNSFSPKPNQLYQAAIDGQVLRNTFQGLTIGRCSQSDGSTVYLPTLASVEVKLKTFIPSPAVSLGELNLLGIKVSTDVFGGDGRGFSYKADKFRSFQSALIDMTRGARLLESSREFGKTTKYNAGDITRKPSDPFWFYNLKPGAKSVASATQAVNDSTNNITFNNTASDTSVNYKLRGSNPLITPPLQAPPIDANLMVQIRKDNNGQIQYKVSGTHDGFPAYEVYINGKRAYSYDPTSTVKSPFNLINSIFPQIKVDKPWSNVTCS